ncbi:hypothetical protein DAPPUDRAFT_322518, partial [Daphnia pulex]
SQRSLVEKLELYESLYSWLYNVNIDTLSTENERKLFIEEVDSNISALMISIYPLCPSKWDKHEPAAILLNQLMQKRMNPQQAEVIDAVLTGKDCLAVMPTGGGKSACYFIPGLLQIGVKATCDPFENEDLVMKFFMNNFRRDIGNSSVKL